MTHPTQSPSQVMLLWPVDNQKRSHVRKMYNIIKDNTHWRCLEACLCGLMHVNFNTPLCSLQKTCNVVTFALSDACIMIGHYRMQPVTVALKPSSDHFNVCLLPGFSLGKFFLSVCGSLFFS